MGKDHIRILNVDLAINNDDDLSSPPPNGAKFNWCTLKLEIPKNPSGQITPLEPMVKFQLVRSPALSPGSWQSIIEARKALLLKNSQESATPAADKLSEDIELAGEGD